ncbi:MAG: hypothetical protein CM1200mP28_14370 [Deltaproteobacteria bacterium]|nr:MAG: hypothetical protein CM1200mP28_14370 [Deltaproteobacteria bacterium]
MRRVRTHGNLILITMKKETVRNYCSFLNFFWLSLKHWRKKGLWSRSSIIQSKCHLQLGNYEEALKSIRMSPESKILKTPGFSKNPHSASGSRHREAIVEIRKLLKHQKKNYYLVSLREELKKSFHTDKGTDFIYHLLHDTRNNKNWFLKDYKLHSMYIKGAGNSWA